jgi:flagellin
MSAINTNIAAMTAARQLGVSQDMLSRSLTRLSSGSKIVNPSDNAAGLAVSEKLGAQNQRVQAASTNVQNAISYLQTADGYMGGMNGILARMSELATLAQDPTKNPSDVANYQQEFAALQGQLRQTVGGTTAEIGGTADVSPPLGSFNGMPLFGPNAAGLTVNIGQNMTIREMNLRQGAMTDLIGQDGSGVYGLTVTSAGVIGTITGATQQLAGERANLGASQSRLDLAASTLQVESQNLSSAISDIRDVDVAAESTQLAKYNILVQAGTAMLAQANQSPQSVLKLLQG